MRPCFHRTRTTLGSVLPTSFLFHCCPLGPSQPPRPIPRINPKGSDSSVPLPCHALTSWFGNCGPVSLGRVVRPTRHLRKGWNAWILNLHVHLLQREHLTVQIPTLPSHTLLGSFSYAGQAQPRPAFSQLLPLRTDFCGSLQGYAYKTLGIQWSTTDIVTALEQQESLVLCNPKYKH